MAVDKSSGKVTKSTGSNNIVKNDGYINLASRDLKDHYGTYGKVIDQFDVVQSPMRAKASPIEVVTGVDVRVPFGRNDYEYFRPNETLPRDFRQMVLGCRAAYTYVGIIRNVIDLMTDFACEDLDLVHQDPKIQAFFKVWSKKVKLFDCAQEFARHFMVDGNVVVKRVTAKLSKPLEARWENAAKAEVDTKQLVEYNNLEAREIPFRYLFLNIANLKWIGGQAAKLADKVFLTFDINPNLATVLRATTVEAKEIMDALPKDIREHIQNFGPSNIPLDMSKLFISYNKKDTWEPWATPYLVSALKDVRFRDKLRQAETCALDGMINTIRIWKLGDHTKDLLPNDAVIQRLRQLLNANVGGGTFDIIWDSMIDLKTEYPPIKDILGSEKYDQVNKDILTGLGVPEVLLGGKGSNFSNSWIQLKTLIQKLKTVREKIVEWIDTEASIICDTMGFDSVPTVKFNFNNLQDETIKQKLIVSLMDRGIISAETVLHTFNEDFPLEFEKLKEEKKEFKAADLDRRNPIQTPEEAAMGAKPTPPTGGRPPMSKDGMKRDSKKPKVRATAFARGMEAISLIDEYITPQYMQSMGADNARKLTTDQKTKINDARAMVLSCVKDGPINKDIIFEAAANIESFNINFINKINELVLSYIQETGQTPILDIQKSLEATAWAIYNDSEIE